MFRINKLLPLGCNRVYFIQCYRYSKATNHYDALGISKNATIDEIKKAYYEQSKLHHPDLKHGNDERFKEINTAYEILGNPRLRKMYDRGLIFEKPSNEPEMGDTTSDSPDASSEPNPIITSEDLNQWSKQQCSATFKRDQKRRSGFKMKEDFRQQRLENRGSEYLFWLLGGIILLVGYFTKQRRKR